MTERNELLRLRDAVEDAIGFGFEEERLAQLGEMVRVRVAALGLGSLDQYSALLRSEEHRRRETPFLAQVLTVTETFFYRNVEQLEAMVEVTVPFLANQGKRIRVLSAGCASGDEPYSIVIALRESLPDFQEWDIEVLAVDVNPVMLTKAERAVYSPWALRSTPEAIRQRYFQAVGKEYLLSDEIRKKVTFRAGNLAQSPAFAPDGFQADAIFCRNVLMYFTPSMMHRSVERLRDLLKPGGYLFLGHAETLRGVAQGFALCHTHRTFYYQKKEGGDPRAVSRPAARVTPDALPLPTEQTGSWFDAIQGASRRVASLTSQRARPAEGRESSRPPTPELGGVVALIQREHFTDALGLLQTLSPDAGAHPDALLLKAVLLTNQGKIVEAEGICEDLFREDQLNAGAHYLKALCREHAGDVAGATEHDRIAAHLDPTFAMPRLHAGLMAKRLQDSALARRELTSALFLLEREDLARLVLFGGGFSRATLRELCSRELAQLGGEA